MCGIVAYVGEKKALPILMEGIHRLEYRGYDSAGIALLEKGKLTIKKAAGKIAVLDKILDGNNFSSSIGFAHTRWATHGEPNDSNAHPHTDCKGKLALIHNGIIENYKTLREVLAEKGHIFRTETDTEVLAHLIEENYDGDLLDAVREALTKVEGTYGIAVLHEDNPEEIIAARRGSPILIARGERENFVASDAAAVLRHTNQVVYLEDKEVARVKKDGFSVSTIDKVEVTPKLEEISWSLEEAEKEGFSHFMQKEISEQPTTLENCLRGRLNFTDGTARLSGLHLSPQELADIDRIIITACGTSWHSALVGEYMLEEIPRIPVEVEYASEFRYRSPVVNPGTIVFAISQSGETADTSAAQREAKSRGAKVLAICNVVGSTIAREASGGLYIHAGPEIGVASTKAFTGQVMTLALITLLLGRIRTLSLERGREFITELQKIPGLVQKILETEDQLKKLAEKYYTKEHFLYLGRGINFPVALEGALKLKEISYIHAEGYPAAEMKHGPIALIDENMPVVVVALKDPIYDKVVSNIQEIKARRGQVIAVATEGDAEIASLADHVIYIPPTLPVLTPMLSVIPLQLLAYHIAVLRGCNVDQPRNLAKSVTVE